MTDTPTSAPADAAKTKREAVALRDWIDASGNPVEAGKEADAIGFRYTHLPSAKRANPAFNPELECAPLEFFEPMLRRVFAAPKNSIYKDACHT